MGPHQTEGVTVIEIQQGPALEEASGDLLALPVFADVTWGPGADWAAGQLGGWLDGYLETQEFSGKPGQLLSVPGGEALPFEQVLFVGVGEDVDAEAIRRAAGSVGRAAAKYETVVTTLHLIEVDEAAELVSFGFLLGQYRFEKYLSEPKPSKTERLMLAGGDDEVLDAVNRGRVVAEGVALARDLINEPAGGKPPEALAQRAREIAAVGGLAIKVYDEDEIVAERFGGLAAVNAGADEPARMVVLDHNPEGAEGFLAFVGKGIVFDSGGLSLKPAKAMEPMKTDMAGAAAVFGAMQAIAALGLPVRVMGIAPITENLTGGAAQRPGDVLRARNGKTIEVLNTDAEGRLVLADGLSLAAEHEPDLIVDIATLTGACAVALGPKIGGLFANDDDASARVAAAAARAGEKVWAMPLEKEYRKHIDSPIADMKNTGEQYGGAISAALLLSEFVGETPWAHLDIAGPARATKNEHYITKGGTGFGVRTLVALAEDAVA